MDIESVPSDKIVQMNVDVLRGFRLCDALNLAVQLKVPTKFLPSLAQEIMGLFQTFKGHNCRIAEINPLVITKDGKLFAGDCLIERGRGSAKGKINSLKEAGVHVVDRPDEIAPTVKKLLKR